MPCRQDRPILQRVALRRGDVADAAVAVLEVVPEHEVTFSDGREHAGTISRPKRCSPAGRGPGLLSSSESAHVPGVPVGARSGACYVAGGCGE